LISVVIATYNGEHYLKQQVDSILNQLSSEDEVIISDDHSIDKTLSILHSIQDPRLQIFSNDPNQRGYSANFENALRHTKGSIIFLADQDDVWLPNKVSFMVDALKTCDFVVSDATVTDADLIPTFDSHFKLTHVKQGFLNNFIKTRYIGACMAFNRTVLDKALPFPVQRKYCPHDYWIALIAEAFFKVNLIPEPLIYYRRHTQNASGGGVSKSTYSLWNQLGRRVYCGTHLILRSLRS